MFFELLKELPNAKVGSVFVEASQEDLAQYYTTPKDGTPGKVRRDFLSEAGSQGFFRHIPNNETNVYSIRAEYTYESYPEVGSITHNIYAVVTALNEEMATTFLKTYIDNDQSDDFSDVDPDEIMILESNKIFPCGNDVCGVVYIALD